VPVCAVLGQLGFFGFFCAALCRCGFFCAALVFFVPLWFFLCRFGFFCAALCHFGFFCAALVFFVLFCAVLGKFGVKWFFLCRFGEKSLQSSPKDLLIPYYIFKWNVVTSKTLLQQGKTPNTFCAKVAKSSKSCTKLHEICEKL
jgi:hypothetical protein